MQSIMQVGGQGAVHAPNLDRHNAATACGIVGDGWVDTKDAVTCQTCIRIMAAQVSKGIPYYRYMLKKALDSEFTYKENDGLLKEDDGVPVALTKLEICEHGITLNAPYNDGDMDMYTLAWVELAKLKDIILTSGGGIDKISIITKFGEPL
jgi:hypothetical protein